jgi:hypothetical protein
VEIFFNKFYSQIFNERLLLGPGGELAVLPPFVFLLLLAYNKTILVENCLDRRQYRVNVKNDIGRVKPYP